MISYQDLLGKDWEDWHCGMVAAEALRRLGMGCAADAIPLDQDGAAEALRRHRSGETVWERVGDEPHHATHEGDIVMYPLLGGRLGVAVYVGGGLLLTSTPIRGVHASSASRHTQITGVFRWRGA